MPLTAQPLAEGNYSAILFSCTFCDARPPRSETHIKHKEPAKSDWHYPKLSSGLMPCHHRHHQSSTAFAAVHGRMPQHFLDVFGEGSGIVSGLCVCAHCRNDLYNKLKHVFLLLFFFFYELCCSFFAPLSLFSFGPLCLFKEKHNVFKSYTVRRTVIHFYIDAIK